MKFWATTYMRIKTANARAEQEQERELPFGTKAPHTIGGLVAAPVAVTGLALANGALGSGLSDSTTTPQKLEDFRQKLIPVIRGQDVGYDRATNVEPHYNNMTHTVSIGDVKDKAILAHEYGHATGLAKNKLYRHGAMAARMASGLGNIAPLVSAVSPDTTEAAALTAAALQAPVLFEEARASWRARNAMKQMGEWTPAARNKLLKAWGTYGTQAAVAPVVALAAGYTRRWLDRDGGREPSASRPHRQATVP
jgi:hypothetical protein